MPQAIQAHIERRYWYVEGKYLGNASPWVPVEAEALEAELIAIGRAVRVETAVEDAIELHATTEAPAIVHSPVRMSDWGQWRVVTERK